MAIATEVENAALQVLSRATASRHDRASGFAMAASEVQQATSLSQASPVGGQIGAPFNAIA